MVLSLDIDDDRTEYCISFDPLLKFWYDPDRVKSVWMTDSNKYHTEDESAVVGCGCLLREQNHLLKKPKIQKVIINSKTNLSIPKTYFIIL
jgi:hypothetical protein